MYLHALNRSAWSSPCHCKEHCVMLEQRPVRYYVSPELHLHTGGVWWRTAAAYFTSGTLQSGPQPSACPDWRDARNSYLHLNMKNIYSWWFNVNQPVPQPSRSEQMFHCLYENTYTYTHAYAYTTNKICLSVIPVFPEVHLELHYPSTVTVFLQLFSNPGPDFDLTDRCEHISHADGLELYLSFSSIHHVPIRSMQSRAQLLHGSLLRKSGTKKGGTWQRDAVCNYC